MNALELVLGTWEPLNLGNFYLFCCVQSYALQHMLQFKLEGRITNYQCWPNMGRITKVLGDFWG